MKIAITTETTVDIPQNLLDKFDIKTVPFTISFGKISKLDGTFSQDEIFEYYEKTKVLPKTSAVNESQFVELFDRCFKEKYDAIIHLASSSEVSCSYQNAISASKNFDDVYVIDTQTLSTGIALLAIKARELANKGLSAFEISKQIEGQKTAVQLSFIVENVVYLYKGGRCSILQLLNSNLLKIKPEITMIHGKATCHHKYRGKMSKCFNRYIEDVFTKNPNMDKKYAFISYTAYNETLVSIAQQKLKEKGFENIYVCRANSTICCHCGNTAIGVLFLNKEQ